MEGSGHWSIRWSGRIYLSVVIGDTAHMAKESALCETPQRCRRDVACPYGVGGGVGLLPGSGEAKSREQVGRALPPPCKSGALPVL